MAHRVENPPTRATGRRAGPWHPTAAVRLPRLGTSPALIGTIHARSMGSLVTACGRYVPEWPMDLTRSAELGRLTCQACAAAV